jgi:AraC-like DNA-binding protein
MVYLRHIPPAPLADFVADLWICRGGAMPRRERITPSGTVELVFNLCDDEIRIDEPERPGRCRRFSGAVVSGTYERAFVIDAMQHASIMGVHFRPAGARLLGVPPGELTNLHVDATAVIGSTMLVAELRERLCEATTDAERFAILEAELTECLHRLQGVAHPVVIAALRAFGPVGAGPTVAAVANATGMSERQFIHVFRRDVGLTPKRFCRVLRFQRACAAARERATSIEWAQLAVRCGYFDQSHLIRDFREFAGVSPTDFLGRSSQPALRHHLPLGA